VSTDESDYTRAAVAAFRRAVEDEPSFPEWLAQTLATAVSDNPKGSFALIAGRPGSWEASFVRQLVGGTVGYDDEHLAQFLTFPGGPDDPARAQD
jgi:hypothetical protein